MANIFTIGHSNREWSDFISILKDNHVDVVVDVRRYPGSRACPQFNKEQMTRELKKENVSICTLRSYGEDENCRIPIDLDTIITIIVDGKIKALEPMPNICRLHHLEMVFVKSFH